MIRSTTCLKNSGASSQDAPAVVISRKQEVDKIAIMSSELWEFNGNFMVTAFFTCSDVQLKTIVPETECQS